jgi:alcohol dehydrogenase class IV
MSIYRFSFPTEIRFGPGARRELGPHLQEHGIKRPLFVTDRAIAALPMLEEVVGGLLASGLSPAVFSGVWGNPVKSQVALGVASYRDEGCDGLVGFGGGAALDVAKAIALMINHPGDLFDYEDEKPGARPFDQPIPHFVAVPTTAGTGSEVGRSAVVSDDETHIKKIIFSPRLLAKAVFADPELTVGLPAGVTAATGMDALTHCIESFLARGYHPLCDGIALEGVHLAAAHLERAVKQPADLEARGAMLMASMMGAIAFQKGLGVVHSCAHALGTVCDLHHGLANGIMIDHALRLNLEVAAERFSRLSVAAALDDTSPAGLLSWLSQLKAQVGIPGDLRAQGIASDQLPRLVEVATNDACHTNNPRPCTRQDFEAIFRGVL